MKTTEMSAALIAFAELATTDRAEELRTLAGTFSDGNDETVAARIKKIERGLRARGKRLRYPLRLRESVAKIAGGLSACKAKQASDFRAVVALLESGDAGGSAQELVSWLSEVLVAAARTPRRTTQPQMPDQPLAHDLADQLTRTVLDPEAFSKVIAQLHDANRISAATLGAIANRFLGNGKRYRGRKSALADITKRHEQDARSHARSKALDGLGV